MIILSNADSQFVLYAKHHFKFQNDLEAMRILVGHRAGCDPQHISDSDIVNVLTMILEELQLKMDGRFIHSIVFGQFGKKQDPVRNFVDAALGLMAVMPVRTSGGEVLVSVQPIDESVREKLESLTAATGG